MAQRSVEIVLGRLATDESFRAAFRRSPGRTIDGLVAQRGLPLTDIERDALAASDPAVWDRVADLLDPRLQRIALTPDDWIR